MPNRTATALLCAGLVAVALLVLPYKLFELDRYFVPKELALHLVALAAAIILLVRARAVRMDAADMFLGFFLVWSVGSALFATNYWLAQRALGLSFAAAIVFWTARALGAAGAYRPVLVAAAFATVVAAGTSLVQAYGITTDYFSLNRAPGGTFGNRNFIAHFCAIGIPALVYSTVTARRAAGALAGSLGIGIVATALVLTRSRAGWLAACATVLIVSVPLLAARGYWGGRGIGGRIARLTLTAFLGAAVAIILPNTLDWTSDSPYLESARGIVDYQTGSGRGRLAQYQNSLRMAAAHPIVGVGPGNWPVEYTEFAPRGDRSIGNDGRTANPWPSSDWVAFVSERGFLAAAALVGVFVSLFISAFRRWPELGDPHAVLAKFTLLGTTTATAVVSAFDAVLLLAAPAFLAWSVIGATSGVGRAGRVVSFTPAARTVLALVVLPIIAASVIRSGMQTAAIMTVGTGGARTAWRAAAALDPGSYRINQRVAELYAARGQCRTARPHARRARDLFPHAADPRRVLRRCG